MTEPEKTKMAIELIQNAANDPEIIKKLNEEYGVNFTHSLAMAEIALKSVAENHVEKIYSGLEKGECVIRFKKADGTTRTARARKYYPDTESKSTRDRNPDQIVYWDLDKEAVRSFNVNRLESFEVVNVNIV